MKKIKNLLVIQARMGSERLPGKVLLKLGKISILEWVIRASKKIRDIDDIIVATTSLKEDKFILSGKISRAYFVLTATLGCTIAI